MAQRIEPWAIPTPFPVGPVNAYRLGGRYPTLIDAGPRTPEAETALLARLEAEPVEALVITHEHVDHAGLAGVLQRRGVRVLLHKAEATTLARWEEAAEERERDYAVGLHAAGVPTERVERMRTAGRKYDAWTDTVQPDGTFAGGDRLRLGDEEYEVVDAPGHTPGSFLLAGPDHTFSGDTILERITPNALSVRESERLALVDYLATLRRIRAREWGLVHPGHGTPFRGAGAIIDRGLERAKRRQEKILAHLGKGPLTVYAAVQRVFPTLESRDLFLAVSEVRGHLELLVHEDRATLREAPEGDQYAAK